MHDILDPLPTPEHEFVRKKIPFLLEFKIYPAPTGWYVRRTLTSIRRVAFMVSIIFFFDLLLHFHRFMVTYKIELLTKSYVLYPHKDISTDCAKIQVSKKDKNGVHTFYNIPYAATPVLLRRFRSSIYVIDFEDCYETYWRRRPEHTREFAFSHLRILAQDNLKRKCLQQRFQMPQEGTENCLDLSIMTPSLRGVKKMKSLLSVNEEVEWSLLPVVVYIGGRSFMEYNPILPSAKKVASLGIVYVNFNYRLGVFGFMDFRRGTFVGNQGISDIQIAFKWLQENLKSFGGDKNQVTLFGAHSGATVGLALLKDLKKTQFFQRLWLHSGSAHIPEADEHPFVAKDIMSSLPQKCDRERIVFNQVKCMSNISAFFLLPKTPLSWRKIDSYYCKLPNYHEKKVSLILPRHSIVDPISLVSDIGWLNTIKQIPLVMVTTRNDIPVLIRDRQYANLTLQAMRDTLKASLDTFQTADSAVRLYDVVMKTASDFINIIKNEAERHNRRNEFLELVGFEEVLKVIITTVRTTKPYNYITKFLIVNGHILRHLYRILDGSDFGHLHLEDENGLQCDVPFLLTDEQHPCQFRMRTQKMKKRMRKRMKDYLKAYRKVFEEFVKGYPKSLNETRYPESENDVSFTETFSRLLNDGFVGSPDVEMQFQLSVADVWKFRGEERPMVMKTASVN